MGGPFPEGEIDFVASSNLTEKPYEVWEMMGHSVKVETAAEIVAKKFFHRGDRATARDLFDLATVIERDPDALATAAPFLVPKAEVFMAQVTERAALFREQFERIAHRRFMASFDDCARIARQFLGN